MIRKGRQTEIDININRLNEQIKINRKIHRFILQIYRQDAWMKIERQIDDQKEQMTEIDRQIVSQIEIYIDR